MNYASLSNYYEHLVYECINDDLIDRYPGMDDEFFLDVACYSLTRLPARYSRHEIDMAFYLAPGERTEMLKSVKNAVDSAAAFISDRKAQG
jgi:hypothetical protein